MPRRRLFAVAAALAVTMLTAACTPGSSGTASPGSSGAPSPAAVKLTVGLGYIPSVQFAPFYLADRSGYYRDAGLDVTFQNKVDPDLVPLVGTGAIDVGLADGTSVIPAASQDIPVRYVATIYRAFPSVVFAKKTSGIAGAADLKGKKLGIPGRYGSSWIMLQALLRSVGLTPQDLQIVEYPDYTQAVAVQQGTVDAATGFDNNEPVQLEQNGVPVNVMTVDKVVALPGPGLIAAAKTLDAKGAAIRSFVAATLRAMNEIATDPAKGLDASIAVVPELDKSRPLQTAILRATIDAWRGGGSGTITGALDRAGWQQSIDFMTHLKLTAKAVTVDDVLRAGLLPG